MCFKPRYLGQNVENDALSIGLIFFLSFFIIRLPLELLPVLGPLERLCDANP